MTVVDCIAVRVKDISAPCRRRCCRMLVNIWERADPSDAGTVRFKLGDGGTLTSINQVDAITASDVLRTVHLTFPVCWPTRLSGAPSASDWETPTPSNLSCNLGKVAGPLMARAG
ncbi:unnamed protein product [Arctogadus glacialis]